LISHLRKLITDEPASVVRLARNFGLRLREAVLADLHEWRRQAKTFGRIDVREGTKGGRGREVERWVPVSEDGMLAIGEAMHLSQSLGCERNLLRLKSRSTPWSITAKSIGHADTCRRSESRGITNCVPPGPASGICRKPDVRRR
jgi:hypothetical protein